MFVVSYSYGDANPATLIVLPSVRIPNSTKQLTTKAGETEGKGNLFTTGVIVNWHSHSRHHSGESQEGKNKFTI